MCKPIISSVLIGAFFFNSVLQSFACGPAYLSPVFDFKHAPERPWTDFASGKLGILKPTHRRIVLTGAYRYLKGGGFTADEQKALIEVWEAEFNKTDYPGDDVTAAVKAWVEERKRNIKNEEKPPAIYTEREYIGGYEFFPNCSKNAFEVARQTLSDRASNEEKDVQEWIKGQDVVFSSCSGGGALPAVPDESFPEWLRKDREYQIAAAKFYLMDYKGAREDFSRISEDGASPWAETAEYLVARTLIREASVGSEENAANPAQQFQIYSLAEQQLGKVLSRSGKFRDSSQKMINLIKYRTRPEERLRELAQNLSYQSSGDNFRQDVIDYNWLIDELESEALKKEETRKAAEKNGEASDTYKNANTSVNVSKDDIAPDGMAINASPIAEAANISANTNEAPSPKTYYPESTYKGGYWGDEARSLAILPSMMREDEITDWIMTFQIEGEEAYRHALSRWQATSEDIWLMTALAKAAPASPAVNQLLKDIEKVSRDSPAYQTIAYHAARLLIEQKKKPEAKKLLDELLNSSIDLPISARNQFMEQRMRLSDGIADFLKYSVRKPFGFGYQDEARSIEAIIAERKSWYNPEQETQSQAEFEAAIDQDFANEKLWQDRVFYDSQTASIINEHFPTELLIETWKSAEMPGYWKDRLALAIWTRAFLLKDEKTAFAMAPEIAKIKPELQKALSAYKMAPTPAERENAGLFVLLKGKYLSPYFSTGFEEDDTDDFNWFVDNRWWCESYGNVDEETGERLQTFKPTFISPAQSAKASSEKAALEKTADGLSYISDKVLQLAKTSPADRRLPEALYIVVKSNESTKYGCGNYRDEIKNRASWLLKKRFPANKWTQRLIAEEREASDNSN